MVSLYTEMKGTESPEIPSLVGLEEPTSLQPIL